MTPRSIRIRPLSLAVAAIVAVSGLSADSYARQTVVFEPTNFKTDTAAVAVGPSTLVASSQVPVGDGVTGRYIVRFSELPIPTYFAAGLGGDTSSQGSNAIFGSIGPRGRRHLNVNNSVVKSYAQQLDVNQQVHLSAIASALGHAPTVVRSYKYALNGVVLDGLSAADLKTLSALAKQPGSGIVSVRPDYIYHSATDIGPGFIGAASIWHGAPAGQDSIFANGFEVDQGYLGDGVVVGDIDTGYNSASPSFAATDESGYTITNPLGTGNFFGDCGIADISVAGCNDKVIGVYDELTNSEPNEPARSVEDSILDGHGSHTGSTAGGNMRTGTFGTFTAPISGMAPHANMVIYRGLYNGSGSSADLAAAADQAIQDGIVDAVNYSISGGTDPWNDPVSLAFLSAADAGIFVAAAAGNTSATVTQIPGTANHFEPWVTTVAATTHTGGRLVNDLAISGTGTPPQVSLFSVFDSPPFSTPIPSSPLVISPQFHNTDLTGSDACTPFAANQFQGDVLIISRGTCNFSVKIANAQTAGAVAIIVSDNRPEDANQQNFTISPTVATVPLFFVTQADGTVLNNYLTANAGATSSIATNSRRGPEQPDMLASFSLLGPNTFGVIKPDVSAPGLATLAAFTNDPANAGPNSIAFDNGTSMATPHITGTAALLMGLHSDWSPAEVKSAIMMTAKEIGLTKSDGTTPSDFFDRGSGRVQAYVASKAGLVMNETGLNYLNANPAQGGNPSTLNIPSMQADTCLNPSNATASCKFQRRFRSTQDHAVTWTVSFTGDIGSSTASPASFNAPAHANAVPINITVDMSAAPPKATHHFGEMVLTPSDSTLVPLHLPIAVKVPGPSIATSPQPLSITIPSSSASSTGTLTVSNVGGPTLNVTNTNDTSPTPRTNVVIDQVSQGNFGFFANFWDDQGAGEYVADDFNVLVPHTNLTRMTFPGFVLSGGNLSTHNGTKIHFEIYSDAGGTPNGNPETVTPSYVWHYVGTIASSGSGMTLTGNTISLNLVTAPGITPTDLAPGTYWMVVYYEPTTTGTGQFPNGWLWFESTAANGNDAMGIVPTGSGVWTDNTNGGDFPGMAMHIETQITCGAPWLSAAPGTLTIGAVNNAPLTVTANSTLFPVGSTSEYAYLCLDSNDTAHPVYATPIHATGGTGVVAAPTVTKAFSPTSMAPGGSSGVTLTLANGSTMPATLSANFVDTLPSGLTATGTAATTCTSGTATVAGDGSSVTLASGAQIPGNGSCTVTFATTAATPNSYTNTIAAGGLQTDKGNNAAAAAATLIVSSAPSLSKAFSPTSVDTNISSTLTITFSNSDPGPATLSSDLVDTFPTGVVVASTTNASSTCTGTFTANAGDGSVKLGSGAQIPAGGCVAIVDVTSASSGTYDNTIAAGALQTDLGSNPTAATAELIVTVPAVAPTVSLAFAPASVPAGTASTLTITFGNVNAANATLTTAFTDALPSGVVVAAAPNASTTCTNATLTINGGDTSVTLPSSAAIPSGGCTLKADVKAAAANVYTNTIAVGALQTDKGSNAASASATLTVTAVAPFFLYSNIGTDANTDLINGATTTVGTTRFTPMTCSRLTLAQPGPQLITRYTWSSSNHNASNSAPTTSIVFYDDSGASGGPGLRLLNSNGALIGGGNFGTTIPANGKSLFTASPLGFLSTQVPAGVSNVWACIFYSSTTLSATVLGNLGVEKYTNAPTAGSTTDLAFVTNVGANFGGQDNPAGTFVSTSGGTANVFGWELVTIGQTALLDTYYTRNAAGTSIAGGTLQLNSATGVARTFAGYAATIAAPAAGNKWSITGMALYPLCNAAATFSDAQAKIQFWDTFNGSSAADVFSNSTPIASSMVDLGPITCPNGTTLNSLSVRLPTPITVVGGSGTLGITVEYFADSGSGLVAQGDLVSTLDTAGVATPLPAIGANASTNGWYKSASNRVDLNFTGGTTNDYVGTTRQSIAIQAYGEQVLSTGAPAAPAQSVPPSDAPQMQPVQQLGPTLQVNQ